MPQSPQGRAVPPGASQPHPRSAPQSVPPGSWNHLQVPSFYAGRQPQHAHMSSEHPLLAPRPPTWHTPSTEPATPLFSLQQMLGAEHSAALAYGRPPMVDLSLPPRSTHSPRNGSGAGNQNGESSSPISLSVRDAKQINSLAERRQNLQELAPPKRLKWVDSILDRVNTGPDSVIVMASHSSHDESSNGSQPGIIISTVSPVNREEDVISPVSNEDSHDSNKSRRKRKPAKTIRMSSKNDNTKMSDDEQSHLPESQENSLLNLTKNETTTTVILDVASKDVVDAPPTLVIPKPPVQELNTTVVVDAQNKTDVEQLQIPDHTPVIVKRRSSSEDLKQAAILTPPKKTRRKTCSESETIDNIAAMIASTRENDPLVASTPEPNVSVPLLDESTTKVNLVNVLSSPTTDRPTESESKPQENEPVSNVIVKNYSKTPIPQSDSGSNTTENITKNVLIETVKVKTVSEINNTLIEKKPEETTNFVEVENQLEKMFAGLEEMEAKKQEDEENREVSETGLNTEKVTSTSSETVEEQKTRKKPTRQKKKPESRRPSDSNSNESTPKKTKGKKYIEDSKVNKSLIKTNCTKKGNKAQQKSNFKPDVQKDIYAYDSGSNASSNRSRGPYIQIKGPRDSPISVNIVNTPSVDEDSEKNVKPKGKKTYHDDNEYRHKVRSKGLHSSTLSMKYDAHTTDTSWICVFCKRGPHTTAINRIQAGPSTLSQASIVGYSSGDLFGPYIISTDCPEYHSSLEALNEVKIKKTKLEVSTNNVSAKFMSKKAKKRHLQMNVEVDPLQESSEPNVLSLEGMLEAGCNKYEIWAHEDCIVWGSGVYLAGARIVGLEGAVWGSCSVRCDICGLRGASVACLARGCGQMAHVVCANGSCWNLDEQSYKAHCQRHKVV